MERLKLPGSWTRWLAYCGRGLGRLPGAVIIAGYLAFVTALAFTVIQAEVGPVTAAAPAATIAAAGAALLMWPPRRLRVRARCAALDGPARWWRRESLLPGWSAGRLWMLSLALCVVVAAFDAASGPHLILIGLLICGPCCALLTARWALTAASGRFALALGIVLGVPDQIFATLTQYAFLAAVMVTTATAAAGAAILQRRHP